MLTNMNLGSSTLYSLFVG